MRRQSTLVRFPLLVVLLVLGAFGCDSTSIEPDLPVEDDDGDAQVDLDILTKLEHIEGATVTEIPATGHFNRLFEILLAQPVDHRNVGAASFQQKIYVGHVSEDRPVVLETEGYSRESFRIRDLAPALRSNQVSVEHRFNGSSIPSPPDWRLLTIRQAADDIHRIVTLLKEIYAEGWVSSGRSKGGEAAIFHRRFYPDDVDATVAIVAPILFSEDDDRIVTYLNTLGDDGCRGDVETLQRSLILKADSIAALLPEFVSTVNEDFGTDFSFTIPYENVVKYAAIEYPFEFWSSPNHDCSSIPGQRADAQELYDHMIEVVEILLFYSDYGVDFWRGWYYQAQTEIGDFKPSTVHIDDLIGDLPELGSLYDFGHELVFDPAPMIDINSWVKSEGDRIIFVYGADDPWSIAQFEIGAGDVVRIINPRTKHETTLYDLSVGDQAVIRAKLSDWLDYENISFQSQ